MTAIAGMLTGAAIGLAFGVAGLLSQLPGFSEVPGVQALFIPIVMHVAPALIGIALLVG